MSVSDVLSRMATIQGQLQMLGGAPATTSAAMAGTTAATAATAASPLITQRSGFSSALDTALSQTAVDSGTVGAGQPSTPGLTTGTGSSAGATVVADAERYLGVPYVWGGTDPTKGLDCSGLVQRVYADLGVQLPRVSADQARVGTPVASLDQAQPGDLLAFGSPVHHIAVYAGNNQMIEAPRTGLDVRISDVYEQPTAIRRIVGDAGSALPAAGTAATAGAVPYADLFTSAGARYGVDPTLLAAIARQESGFNAAAVSPAGAQGLMQLMPSTATSLGVTDSLDPAEAVDGAARLMADLTQRFGSTPLALAAYNAGPGAVLRYGGVPPYPETQHYVSSIMSMVGASS